MTIPTVQYGNIELDTTVEVDSTSLPPGNYTFEQMQLHLGHIANNWLVSEWLSLKREFEKYSVDVCNFGGQKR